MDDNSTAAKTPAEAGSAQPYSPEWYANQLRTLGRAACDQLGFYALPEDFLLSVVIPVYNGANYLAEAIDSALAQIERQFGKGSIMKMGGDNPIADVCLLKNQATQTMEFCAREGVQIFGGAGYLRGAKVERIYREVRVNAIGGGAEEIMRDLAVRQMGL